MKKHYFLKSTLCLLLAMLCNVAWAQIEVSTSVDTPENTYSLLSKNGAYMSVGTGATQYRLGRFAFYAAEGENVYKIYSVDGKKWVSYTKAASYGGGANKATLVDAQVDAQAWYVVANGDYYNIAPLKNDGTLGGQYWNFHGGAGASNKTYIYDDNKTVGFYNQAGDGGSLWTLEKLTLATEEQVNAAKALIAVAPGYPKTTSSVYVAMNALTYGVSSTKHIDLAVPAYKTATDIILPEDGKAYTFTSVMGDAANATRYYMKYVNGQKVTVSKTSTDASVFVCKELSSVNANEKKYAFVTDDGHILTWIGNNEGDAYKENNNIYGYSSKFATEYNGKSDWNEITVKKNGTAAKDLGYLRLVARRNSSGTSSIIANNNNRFDQASDGYWFNGTNSSAWILTEVEHTNTDAENLALAKIDAKLHVTANASNLGELIGQACYMVNSERVYDAATVTTAIDAATTVEAVNAIKNSYAVYEGVKLTSKSEFVSGGVYAFVTARGWMGATEACRNVISTAKASHNVTGGYYDPMFQWVVYISNNGNYYLYNLGKQMFMGVQSANNVSIPFAEQPAGKNLTFKQSSSADYPIMFSTDNAGVANHSTSYGDGLITWTGGWSTLNDEGSNHKVTLVSKLPEATLQEIAAKVEAYDRSMPIKVEVEGWTENNPNTHFGNVTATTGTNVSSTKLLTAHMAGGNMAYSSIGDVVTFTREYRGFEFQGYYVGEQSLGKSFPITEELASSITAETPLVAKFTATDEVTLFYDDDEFSYRIPAIATTSTGRLIAVSDYRYSLDDIGRYNFGAATPGIDLVIRMSDDNGKTWGPTKTIAKCSGKRGANDCAYGDAAIAVVGQKVLVMGAAGDVMFGHGSATAHNRTVRIFSEDNGVTWTAPQDISETFFINDDATINSAYSLFFGSGKLAVDENYNGTGKARIYGAVLVRKNGIGNGIYVVYTDDFGISWSILGGSQTHITANDEPKVEILPSGQILLSVRRGGGRQFNVFTYTDKANNAGSWNSNQNGCNNGGDNTCNGEIFLVDAKNALGEDVKLLLQSQPKGGSGLYDRRDVTIWYKEVDNTSYTSSQIAGNWIEGMQVSTQQSAYSTMSLQEDGKIAFFFEEAPCYGDDQAKGYCMVYTPLTIEEITKNKYFSLDADFSTEVTINVELTDAQGNKYRDQLQCALPDVVTTLTTKYPFITLGNEAKLSAQNGAYSYTNKVTLPFRVSNTKLEIWHHIYFPINTNEYNYPAYMAQGNPIVSIVTESAVYGNGTYNTRAKADEVSWAIYQSAEGAFSFILKNKYRNQYLYTTAAATTATKVTNVQYTDNKAKASAFVPSTAGRNPNFQGEYSLMVGNGYICVTAVANGYVTYSTNRNHKGAWAKFEVVPNYASLINEVKATLNLFGTGLGQYATTQEATAAKAAMNNSGNVKLNDLNTYKDLTKNATLNMPQAGRYFRIKGISGNYIDATSIYNNANAKTGQMSMKSASECNYKGTIFYLDENNHLVNYATGTCVRETREIGATGDAAGVWSFAESPRKGAGKYALSCTTTNNNGAHLHDSDGNRADRCSNNCGNRHDFTLEEVTELPVSIGSTGFGTLYAPVALTLPEGVKAFTGTVSQEKGEHVLTLYEVKEAIPAGTGVILQSETKNKDYEFAITTSTASSVENDLMGSVISFVYSKSGYQPYTLQTSTQSSSGVAFKRYNGPSVTGGKVYIELPSTQNAAAVRVRFAGEDVTEIENSEFIIQDSEFIYDLTGRRVETMDKGVYIVNGKKVVIK